MCCATGVCGPSVDPVLIRFSADVEWLKEHGVEVERNNLSQQPQAFTANGLVREALERGIDILPLVVIDGQMAFEGAYPTRAELATRLGLEDDAAPSLFTPAVAELVAIGAAVAANCEPCFRAHYDRAHKLGVAKADMWLAVQMAQAVKEQPAKLVLQLATRYLNTSASAGPGEELPVTKSKGCC
jgi:AhpD family alkylhydroperoxidase